MVQVDYKEDQWNKGTFRLDFGWDESNCDYVLNLLKGSAFVLPTYEDECRYRDLVDRLAERRDENNRTPLSPEEMAELVHFLLEFICEADAVMNISGQEESSMNDMTYGSAEYAGALLN